MGADRQVAAMDGAKDSATEVNKKRGGSPKVFLTEVAAEMKKVSWSTRQELVNYTGVVAITVAVVCALIWICDTIFARIFHFILR